MDFCGGDLSHPLEIISSKPVLGNCFAYIDNENQSCEGDLFHPRVI